VLDSPFSSSRVACAALLLCLSALAAGCATVRPQDKELLADPSMTFNADGIAGQHEQHVLDNREGSYGGTSTRGGGCGCN
jgi:hypothetical protein